MGIQPLGKATTHIVLKWRINTYCSDEHKAYLGLMLTDVSLQAVAAHF